MPENIMTATTRIHAYKDAEELGVWDAPEGTTAISYEMVYVDGVVVRPLPTPTLEHVLQQVALARHIVMAARTELNDMGALKDCPCCGADTREGSNEQHDDGCTTKLLMDLLSSWEVMDK